MADRACHRLAQVRDIQTCLCYKLRYPTVRKLGEAEGERVTERGGVHAAIFGLRAAEADPPSPPCIAADVKGNVRASGLQAIHRAGPDDGQVVFVGLPQ